MHALATARGRHEGGGEAESRDGRRLRQLRDQRHRLPVWDDAEAFEEGKPDERGRSLMGGRSL